MTTKLNLLNLTPDDAERALHDFAARHGEPAYRARQVDRRLWRNPAPTFEAMTDLPAPLRARLDA